MTAFERLLAEDLPDGSFGGARTTGRPRRKAERQEEPAPDPEAAEHCRQLLAALDARPARPRLRVIPGEAA